MKTIRTIPTSLPVLFPDNELRKHVTDPLLKKMLENPPKFEKRFVDKYGSFVVILKGSTYDGRITSHNISGK